MNDKRNVDQLLNEWDETPQANPITEDQVDEEVDGTAMKQIQKKFEAMTGLKTKVVGSGDLAVMSPKGRIHSGHHQDRWKEQQAIGP